MASREDAGGASAAGPHASPADQPVAAPPAPPPAAGYRRVKVAPDEAAATAATGDSGARPSSESDSGARDGDVRATPHAADPSTSIRWAIVPVSLVLCVAQVILTTLAENLRTVYLTSTLIAVTAYGAVFLIVLGVNPVLRALSWRPGKDRDRRSRLYRTLRPLSRAEVMCVFTALLVTSGISTFGLASQVVPLIASPWNPEWNTPQRGWHATLLPHLNRELYIDIPADGTPEERAEALEQVRMFREGLDRTRDGRPLRAPHGSAGWGEWLPYYFAVAVEGVPWSLWLPPLGYWLIFVAAAYGLFFSLAYLVLPTWSDQEKLIFPLAKLPETLLPDEGRPRWVPAMFTRSIFWFGFVLSFGVLSWNGAVGIGSLPGLAPIPLGMGTLSAQQALTGTAFHGLAGSLAFLIIFTAVGIAFLLPTEISFSAWFYLLAAMAMLLVATWWGYGTNARDFPVDWLWISNFISSQGLGAILLFSSVYLYLGIRRRLAATRGTPIERLRQCPSLLGLIVSFLVMLAWLAWNRLTLLAATLVLLYATLLTFGLMRIVAQCGIYWFQSYASFFHLYRMSGMGRWIPPVLLGPLLPIYTVLFVDLKTFIAPNILNAARMHRDVGGGRVKFQVNLVLCLAVSVAAALGFHIVLAYVRGGQAMNLWFYTQSPQRAFDLGTTAMTTVPAFDRAMVGWCAVGAAWTALSLVLRRSLFWFPHPIGYLMLINPLMRSLWFSFFIGWLCKRIVTRYGGKFLYDRTLGFFVGLIMGELMAIFIWAALGLWRGWPVTIDLNRLG